MNRGLQVRTSSLCVWANIREAQFAVTVTSPDNDTHMCVCVCIYIYIPMWLTALKAATDYQWCCNLFDYSAATAEGQSVFSRTATLVWTKVVRFVVYRVTIVSPQPLSEKFVRTSRHCGSKGGRGGTRTSHP